MYKSKKTIRSVKIKKVKADNKEYSFKGKRKDRDYKSQYTIKAKTFKLKIYWSKSQKVSPYPYIIEP